MRLCVLGPVVLEGAEGIVAVPGSKARQMLTVLALSSPPRLSLDQLVDALWVEPPPSAIKTVQAHASRLRRALATAGAPSALTSSGPGYQVNLGSQVDTAELARAIRRAESAREGGDVRLAAELLGDARKLWRGDPELPDTPTGDALRRRLHDERLELTIAHLAALVDSGAADHAVAELGELVAAERLNERVWELRILALYRSGRPTEALRAFRDVATLLAEEVGVVPGPALRELEARILAHDDAAITDSEPGRARRTGHDRDVSYAHNAGMHIAHRTFGRGETPVLLLSPGLISVDAMTDEPHFAAGLARLSEHRRVVAFDPRGIGLSDRTQPVDTITIDDWVDDARTVLAANEIDTAHVFAAGHGGLVGLTLAARHPHQIRSLTLFNAFARYARAADYPYGIDAEMFAAMQTSMQATDPGPRLDALSLISPSVAADPDYRRWWDTAGRRAASPAAASTLVTMMARADLRHVVPEVAVPALVIARQGCPVYDAGLGEYLARHLPNATLQVHHDVNDPWWIGDSNFVLAAFDRFLASLPQPDASSQPNGGTR